MSKKVRAAWGIPFSAEQKDLADKLIGRLNATQISLLDAYFNGEEHAQQKVAGLLQKATQSSGGSQENVSPTDPKWGLSVLEHIAKNPPAEYNRTTPFYAPIVKREALTKAGSTKETYHIELSLQGSGLEYAPGDSCGVFGHNSRHLVEGIIEFSRLDENTFVAIEKGFVSLREALTHHLELTNLTGEVLMKYNQYATDEKLTALLADRNKTKGYVHGRDVLDMLKDFPAVVSAEQLCSMLKKMRPRLYSIASSLSAHPNEVHLTVGAVRYNAHGRDKEGTCSTYLADRIFDTSKVPVFIQKNNSFRLPADTDAPIIMIGAGTGIAPYRAFVEERAAKHHTGDSWLFFGNPHSETDFLYEDELKAYHKSGFLSELSLAFSRDQAEKVYVQHLITKQSQKVYQWLQNGTTIYVCGSRANLGQSVRDAFAEVLVKEAAFSEADAKAEVLAWKKAKRYHEDVY